MGLYDRATIFLKRVGGIIVALSILLWFLVTFPLPPDNPTMPPINYSIAGRLGHLIHPIFAPIGFTWEICIALIPAMAAREVIIAALGVIYAMSGDENAVTQTLLSQISGPDGWGLATGMCPISLVYLCPTLFSNIGGNYQKRNRELETANHNGYLSFLVGLLILFYNLSSCESFLI